MRVSLILAAGVVSFSAASAAAAGPGLGAPGLSSPGLGTPGRPSPGLGAGLGAPLTPQVGSPTPPAPRPYYAPVAPIAKIPEPKPMGGFKPFKGRSTYDEPSAPGSANGASRPKGYHGAY